MARIPFRSGAVWMRLGYFAVLVFCAGVSPLRAQEGSATEKLETEYTYKGEKARDPFLPLVGQGVWDVARTGADSEEFNPAGVELKGILQTKTARLAVLRTPTGASFLVKNGKIQDAKRKIIEGYVGIIKEKSLVIIGPNNQVTEMKLKKDQETKSP